MKIMIFLLIYKIYLFFKIWVNKNSHLIKSRLIFIQIRIKITFYESDKSK